MDSITGKPYHFINSSFVPALSELKPGIWVEALAEGRAQLYVQHKKTLSESRPYGSATLEQRILTIDLFYLVVNNNLVRIKKFRILLTHCPTRKRKCSSGRVPTRLKRTSKALPGWLNTITALAIEARTLPNSNQRMRPSKYLSLLLPVFNTQRTREILGVNPVIQAHREDAAEVRVSVFAYNASKLTEHHFNNITECLRFSEENDFIHWINIDGLRKADVELVCSRFGIHPLITEDILSVDQRPKMDDIEGVLYCLLNMLYFNEVGNTVEQEQISIVLGKNFVISFQEDPERDVFNRCATS